MEATLNNLQKIDLEVLVAPSQEYRNTDEAIPEMAKELNVTYLAGGQQFRDRRTNLLKCDMTLNGASNRHLWKQEQIAGAKQFTFFHCSQRKSTRANIARRR
ncbi:MAG: hypothetical protein U5K54_16845 [Cytophagales bacterium]|nr:hypothetical protein [Cytophagales bacterium]